MKRLPLTLALLGTLGFTSCGNGPFSNPFEINISATFNPSTLTTAPGTTSRVQVTATAASKSVTSFTMTPHDLPEGFTVTPSTGALAVTTASTVIPGTYAIPVTLNATGGKGEAVLAVDVRAVRPTVTLSPNPAQLTAGQRLHVSATTTTASLTIISITGMLPTVIDEDGRGFTVISSATSAPGTYALTVTASVDGQTVPTTFTTEIQEAK